MELTSVQKRRKIWLEIKDLLVGAAFPLMLQLVFSASVILFADYNEDAAIQVVALVFGEALLIGAYIIFGRQNGITAYRRTAQGVKKRELNPDDVTANYKTGEYALYKGFLIGFISTLPFIIFQLIQCLVPNDVCGFLLKYAFGWAAFPFILIQEIPSVAQLSEWLNFIWIVIPVGVHAAAYILGARGEKLRQQKIEEAQKIKGKRRR